jgi:hypothetical protein
MAQVSSFFSWTALAKPLKRNVSGLFSELRNCVQGLSCFWTVLFPKIETLINLGAVVLQPEGSLSSQIQSIYEKSPGPITRRINPEKQVHQNRAPGMFNAYTIYDRL